MPEPQTEGLAPAAAPSTQRTSGPDEIARLTNLHRAQERAEPWATERTLAIDANFPRGDGYMLEAVDCRATLCILDVSYDPLVVDPAMIHGRLGDSSDFPTQMYAWFGGEMMAEHRVRIFIAREGHPFR